MQTATLVSSEFLPNPERKHRLTKRLIFDVDMQSGFDLDRYQQALDMIKTGISPITAAKNIGLAVSALYDWKDIDERVRGMWDNALETYAMALVAKAGACSEKLCNDQNVLSLPEPKLANAWVQSLAQGAKAAIEVAKRLAPRLYGDRIEHTGSQTQVAFVVSVAPTATVQAQLEGPATDSQAITIQPLERSAPRRPGRPGKQTKRQPTPPSKRRPKNQPKEG